MWEGRCEEVVLGLSLGTCLPMTLRFGQVKAGQQRATQATIIACPRADPYQYCKLTYCGLRHILPKNSRLSAS